MGKAVLCAAAAAFVIVLADHVIATAGGDAPQESWSVNRALKGDRLPRPVRAPAEPASTIRLKTRQAPEPAAPRALEGCESAVGPLARSAVEAPVVRCLAEAPPIRAVSFG
ncbi:MAG: hypothetical protein IRZ09_00955 [Variibacter sp.]|nr:hypothetical protein [Variibacter sp.]